MKEYLVSRGGLLYLPHMPARLILSVPEPGTRFEITDLPFASGYDQTKFVSRKSAEILVEKYPDMWAIEWLS